MTSPSSISRPRAPIVERNVAAAAISGRAESCAATTTVMPGASAAGDIVDLETVSVSARR